MCGIVGYVGAQDAVPILLDGMKKLEYRGYDSAGIAVITDGAIELRKYKGRLAVLEERLKSDPRSGSPGIGHTRWATHGEPSDRNSHPHTGMSGDLAVVHNGIIENYLELKNDLLSRGAVFTSETDTEVLAQYLGSLYKGDLVEAVRAALRTIRGSYAFVVMCSREPDKLVCVRKENPLVIGAGVGENFIASDIPALLSHTRTIYLPDENELAVVTKGEIRFFDPIGNAIMKTPIHVSWDIASAEKGGYDHFMLKEIYEQPRAIRDTLSGRIEAGHADAVSDVLSMTSETLKALSRIFIVACGTAYHAGLVGKHLFEEFLGIPTEVRIASEFRYICPTVNQNSLTIAISQSGETLDTLMALKEAKKRGSRTLGIVNVVGSTIARESDDVLYTRAGPEIAVASTKAYTAQLSALCSLTLALSDLQNVPEKAAAVAALREGLPGLPALAEAALLHAPFLQDFAKSRCQTRDLFLLGRGLDYVTALEGALKLKELSYVHAEAFPAGELKHGPIALIEEGTLVIALLTQSDVYDKVRSNIKEVKARGAYVLAITGKSGAGTETAADETIVLPHVPDFLAPAVSVIPLQLLAYYLAVARGCDVDKPRNLAKSVTVE